ncbi:TolC family protein [Flavobacterium aquicola]|uniref:Outer membrane protein TolC n=1 Tax=Flavobacterium aquicola TaxID=1682742 RepID=A0A3E0EUE9_9FLAO|nr:TolC family protein [Flavobacterium aquicola]REH01040.1 outer membrane protein TolC [Flavobacterium aquicola]
MKVSYLILFGGFFVGISSITAQEKTNLKLEEAIQLAWTKSNEVTLANTKADTKKHELQSAKNNQYPDLTLSGQFLGLNEPTISSSLINGDSSEEMPVPGHIAIGQASLKVPIFSGFKIQNSIKLQDNLFQAENAMASKTKEDVAMRVINYYANLYKSQRTIELIKENQKSAQQRVTDFIALEKNGIIPRNDLLKAQLQVSRLQLSLDEAINNETIFNYYLVTLLKLPTGTKLVVNESDLINFPKDEIPTDEKPAFENRKDLEALKFQEKASLNHLKMAQSNYYPTIALTGGYAALNIQHVLTVQNAMFLGVGVSYDLSGILKNGTEVKVAKSKTLEVQNSEELLKDNIRVQVQQAITNYDLAVKQSIVLTEAVGQSTENYRIVKDKNENGLADTNDLLDADVEQLRAKISETISKVDVIQKYYELLSTTGQLSQTFNLSKI